MPNQWDCIQRESDSIFFQKHDHILPDSKLISLVIHISAECIGKSRSRGRTNSQSQLVWTWHYRSVLATKIKALN